MKSNWIVLGSHPGDGGEYKADCPKDALIAFFADTDGTSMAAVRRDFNNSPTKLKKIDTDYYIFGSYEVKRIRRPAKEATGKMFKRIRGY